MKNGAGLSNGGQTSCLTVVAQAPDPFCGPLRNGSRDGQKENSCMHWRIQGALGALGALGARGPPCPQDFFYKIMQFSGNCKGKPLF